MFAAFLLPAEALGGRVVLCHHGYSQLNPKALLILIGFTSPTPSSVRDMVGSYAFAYPQPSEDQEAPDQLAPDQLAPDQLAPDQLAPDQLAPLHEAPDQLAPDQLAPLHEAPLHEAPDQLAPLKLPPFHRVSQSVPLQT